MVHRCIQVQQQQHNKWDKKGIRYVADLIDNKTGNLYSRDDLIRRYNVKMTLLCYTSLVRSLPAIVKNTNYKYNILYPIIPYKIRLSNGNKNIQN